MVKKKKDGLHETCICSSTAVSLTDTANMKIWKLSILQSLCINNLQCWIQLSSQTFEKQDCKVSYAEMDEAAMVMGHK